MASCARRTTAVARAFVRTRDPAMIERAEIVFDVGGVYDPGSGRYDHHMPGERAPKRDDGSLYSSAGLIWRDFGRAALRSMASGRGADGLEAHHVEANIEELWSRIDHGFIRQIDRIDTGEEKSAALSYTDQIDTFNPNWTEEIDADTQFRAAADFAMDTLRRVTKRNSPISSRAPSYWRRMRPARTPGFSNCPGACPGKASCMITICRSSMPSTRRTANG